MRRLLAVIQKELLVLGRDKAGLLVLFVMPAVLVVIITLVQENALKTMGESDTRILLIDDDGQALGQQIADVLETSEGVIVERPREDRVAQREQAMKSVARGDYQVCLIIPPELTEKVRKRARLSAMESLSGKSETGDSPPVPVIEIYFDPMVLGGFRSAVRTLLDLMILRLEVKEKMTALAQILPEHIDKALSEELKPVAEFLPQTPQIDLSLTWSDAPLLRVEDRNALAGDVQVIPTSVQHNVPAWALFGIFFIVLPMAGAFIQERLNGTRQRLSAMPVGEPTLMCGRIMAYVLICVGQCLLIGCIGKWLLPVWGTPPLEMGENLQALVVMAASAILAATGYGILLGTVVNSFEQAAMVGPISIVIAAALGGIMVPVYAMPAFMQKISVISPLAWGLNGTLDVFVRGGGLTEVLPEAGALTAFFIGCLLAAGLWRNRRRLRRKIGYGVL
jgi:ABC-2 type transport system permease protein